MQKTVIFFVSLLFLPLITEAQTEIVSYEYWWNNDFQQKNEVVVSPSQLLELNQVVTANHLNYGVHQFNFRAKDNQGFYSPTLSQFFQHLPTTSGSQKNIVAYEYWMNDDHAQVFQVTTSAAQQVNVQALLSSQNLPTGIHSFHIRFKDDAGFWSATASQFFYKQSNMLNHQGEILAYEYWYNDDYASAAKVNVSPQQSITVQELLNVNHLPSGLHAFHIRFLDDKQLWSSTTSQFFYKTPSTITGANKEIVAYEYWINDDYANAQIVPQTQQQVINVQELISLTHLTDGLHTFHIRFQDNSNLWSSTSSQFFYKTPNTITGANKEIVAYEYWINDDYANAQIVPQTQQQVINVQELISLTHLTDGLHTFHIRFQDNSNLWSSTTSQFFHKLPTQTPSNTEIIAYKYWLGNQHGNAQTVTLSPPSQQFILLDDLPLTHISQGNYTIHFQFQDNNGRWSSATTDTIFKNPLPIADFEADTTQFCANLSNIVQFSNLSIDGNEFLWDFGDGNSSTLENPVHTYSAPGAYNVSLQVIDSVSGLDSTFVWPNLIEVFDVASSQITIDGNDSICDGQTTELIAEANFDYLWNTGQTGQSIVTDSTGAYWVTITNPNFSACVTNSDTVMVNVFAMPNPQLTALPSDSICDGEVVQISAESNYLYAWNTNETTQEITVNSAGTYWATLFNPDYTACAVQSDTVNITIKPLPIADFDLTQNDYEVDFLDQSQFADSHWWNFGDGNTSSLPSPSHTYSSADLFEAILIVENSCGTDTAFQVIDLTYLSVEEMKDKYQLSVHPNPSNGVFYLTVDQERLQQQFTLLDSQGRIVAKGVLQDLVTQLDLTAQQSGVYMLVLGDKIFRLVKN
jgi:PKD repeat protein/Cu/Zn superoxide dismutase